MILPDYIFWEVTIIYHNLNIKKDKMLVFVKFNIHMLFSLSDVLTLYMANNIMADSTSSDMYTTYNSILAYYSLLDVLIEIYHVGVLFLLQVYTDHINQMN